MKITKFVLEIMACCASVGSAHAQVIINEVMQSNIDCIIDDLNDFPDSWAELLNVSEDTIDIAGYRIGTKDKFAKAYELPSATIAPGDYLLVYCDKVGEGLHPDFRIDSGKGNLYLFNAQGDIIDNIALAKQPAPNVAYGRAEDAADEWGYQIAPSPAAANMAGVSDVVLGAPVFSRLGGVFAEGDSLEVALSLPDDSPAGARIIYTLTGEEPRAGNALEYADSVPLIIGESTVVRAKVVADSCITVPSTAQSYIFLDREHRVKVVSIVIDPEYLYGDTIGILTTGIGGNDAPNYQNNWRRPLNLEIFKPGEEGAAINQLCETRVHGNTSRQHPMKSMVLYANKRFGEKRFATQLWESDKPDVTEPQSFLLRNGGGAFARGYVQDALAQRVMGRNSDAVDWQAYSPAVVFINGQYHGVLNIRERSDEDNIAANYGGLEDIDIVEYVEAEADKINGIELSEYYAELLEFGREKHEFEEWAQMIDLESYADLFILNTWVCNRDFPGNNQVLWRRTDDGDPRWRWLLKDLDQGLGLYGKWAFDGDYHTDWLLRYADSPKQRDCYLMLYNLLDCPKFVEMYVDRFVAHIGDFLNAKTFNEYLDEIIEENCGELHISHAKWNQVTAELGDISLRELDDEWNKIRNWVNGRQLHMPAILSSSMGLGAPVSVKVTVDNEERAGEFSLVYDGVKLSKCAFDGHDFVGRIIRLEVPEEISGWRVAIGDAEPYIQSGNSIGIPIETEDEINVTILATTTSLADAAREAKLRYDAASGAVYGRGMIVLTDLQGRIVAKGVNRVALPATGLYIARGADGSALKIF